MAKRPNNLVLVTPFVMVIIGVIAVSYSTVIHFFDHIQAMMTVVKHPTKADFSAYTRLLQKHVKTVEIKNLLDYKAIKTDPDLSAALKELATTSPDKLDELDSLLYWVNAYNLLAIKCVADRFPVESGKQTSSDLHKRLFVVGGKNISVGDILSTKIHPAIKGDEFAVCDERIVYLTCRGTMGEPNVLNHAITRETLADDIATNMHSFIENRLTAYINRDGKTFYISPWFEWHRRVFGLRHREMHSYVLSLMKPEDRRENGLYCLRSTFPKFDWRINDIQCSKQILPPNTDATEYTNDDF